MKAWKGVWFKVDLGFHLSWGALEPSLVIEQPLCFSPLPFDTDNCLSLNFPGFRTRLINLYPFCASQQSLLNPVTPLYVCFCGHLCVHVFAHGWAPLPLQKWDYSQFFKTHMNRLLFTVGHLYREVTLIHWAQLITEMVSGEVKCVFQGHLKVSPQIQSSIVWHFMKSCSDNISLCGRFESTKERVCILQLFF